MTYQELLDEFCNREWAVQSILEKLRDTQEGPR